MRSTRDQTPAAIANAQVQVLCQATCLALSTACAVSLRHGRSSRALLDANRIDLDNPTLQMLEETGGGYAIGDSTYRSGETSMMMRRRCSRHRPLVGPMLPIGISRSAETSL